MNDYEKSLTTALLTAGLQSIIYESPESCAKRHRAMQQLRTGREPWHRIQLSKAERKGKTPDEIRALRIQKWEHLQEEV